MKKLLIISILTITTLLLTFITQPKTYAMESKSFELTPEDLSYQRSGNLLAYDSPYEISYIYYTGPNYNMFTIRIENVVIRDKLIITNISGNDGNVDYEKFESGTSTSVVYYTSPLKTYSYYQDGGYDNTNRPELVVISDFVSSTAHNIDLQFYAVKVLVNNEHIAFLNQIRNNFVVTTGQDINYDSLYQILKQQASQNVNQDALEDAYLAGKAEGLQINQNAFDDGYYEGMNDYGYFTNGQFYSGQQAYNMGLIAGDQASYDLGFEEGSKTGFVNNINTWIVPAILITLIAGGVIYMLQRRRSE